jgi:hypothetical protein
MICRHIPNTNGRLVAAERWQAIQALLPRYGGCPGVNDRAVLAGATSRSSQPRPVAR